MIQKNPRKNQEVGLVVLIKNKMNLEKIFSEFLDKENLLEKKILLLVSGGVDSIVLLNVASKVCRKSYLEVLSFDHGVRKKSVQDLGMVKDLCKKLEIKFYGERIQLNNKSDQENSWRKIRKEISRDLANKVKAERILTAHHATDLVETMIFRLTKGCGPSGLSPFDLKTKPFWQVPKEELIKYAQENDLKWNEDETNKKVVHNRNLIRHKVLPELRKITPNLEQVFVREAEIFAGVSDYLEKEIDKKINRKEISLNSFLDMPLILQMEFLRKISRYIASTSELNDCLKWLKNDPQGGSRKEVGGTELKLIKNKIKWEI